MDRVGDFRSYLALCDDARAYDDVLIAMHGEAEAARVIRLEAEAKRGRR